MKLAKLIMRYVLKGLDGVNVVELKTTLENALKLADGLDSEWTAEAVLTALFKEAEDGPEKDV